MAKKMCEDCGIRPVIHASKSYASSSEGMFCQPCYDYAGMENEHSDHGHDTLADMEPGIIPEGWYTQGGYETWTDEQRLADIEAERANMATCPICHPELDPRNKPVRKGHTNTRAHSWNSHSACKHPTTPKARAACRKAGGPVKPE